MINDDERIALFLDYENLAIGARDGLGVSPFDFGPIADALAERGRVVTRRAYADWSYFDEDRRLLTRAQVELIEIPQRMGGSRKNAADIKMAVDAVQLALEREFVTTFAIATGDSDFTPLVHKLRELDKRVIGIGVQSSTSALLPPACDEFLFYDRLPGVEPVPGRGRRRGGRASSGSSSTPPGRNGTATQPAGPPAVAPVTAPTAGAPAAGAPTAGAVTTGSAGRAGTGRTAPGTAPALEPTFSGTAAGPPDSPSDSDADTGAGPGTAAGDVGALVARTLSGLQRHSDGPVLASRVKRAILRKDPTFDESDHGFRSFGELLRRLEAQRVVELRPGSAQGDPEVGFPQVSSAEDEAFGLLVDVVGRLRTPDSRPQLSGLKDQLRKRSADFSEKRHGFQNFLSFARAAAARDLVTMEWNEDAGDYLLDLPTA